MNEGVILELYKNQNHFDSSIKKEDSLVASNFSCGDEINLHVEIQDGKINKATFSGSACSITLASAEYLCREIEGKSVTEINPESLQQACLSAFEMLTKERRVLCALLPYQSLEQLKLHLV